MKYVNPIGRRLALLMLGAAIVIGCSTSRLPGYARPSVVFVDNEEMDMSDVIAYRELVRDDFRGGRPPSDFDERMAAVTCVYTQPLVDKQGIEIELAGSEDGEPVFEVTYNNLRYRALMNRGCSWWNPNTRIFEEDYILEHEQIHFALFEAAAREWNREPPLRVRVRRQDPAAQLRERLDALRAQNLRFDEETSLGHNPDRQRQWLDEVMTRLEKNAAYAAVVDDEEESGCAGGAVLRGDFEKVRRMLDDLADGSAVARLVDEAEAAAALPECDTVRARILIDRAIELIGD